MNYLQRQNAACRVEWQRRQSYGIRYKDIREFHEGRVLDESYAMARMVARVIAEDIVSWKREKLEKMRALMKRASNVHFLRKQAC